jgi:hypothetical protein
MMMTRLSVLSTDDVTGPTCRGRASSNMSSISNSMSSKQEQRPCQQVRRGSGGLPVGQTAGGGEGGGGEVDACPRATYNAATTLGWQ